MKYEPHNPAPADAEARKSFASVICYPIDTLPPHDPSVFAGARESMKLIDEVTVRPRDAETFHVAQGNFFRIVCPEGPQVGDLNLWNADDLNERFFSGKTRALYGTHVSIGDKLMSNMPYLRAMATVTFDTLDWYGWDEFGGSVHDVIGTRCDPYTNALLNRTEYHNCCHSNLIRALARRTGMGLDAAEPHIHDVLNVFMCSGFTPDTKQYFIKASPDRRLSRDVCGDQSAGGSLDMSGRRLFTDALKRYGSLRTPQGGDIRACGRHAVSLGGTGPFQLQPQSWRLEGAGRVGRCRQTGGRSVCSGIIALHCASEVERGKT